MWGRPEVPSLIVRFDAPSFEPLEPILDELEGLPVWGAVGWPLVVGVGPTLIHHLRHGGLQTVFDLRLWESKDRAVMITETLVRAGAQALTVDLRAELATVQACREAARGQLLLIGATGLGAGDVAADVERLASGLDGVMLPPQWLSVGDRFPHRWALLDRCALSDLPSPATATARVVSAEALSEGDPAQVVAHLIDASQGVA